MSATSPRAHALRITAKAAITLCASAGLASPALAQGASANALQTVEVTAQKRTQNLQVVPVSVDSISAGDLERAGIKDLFNLGDLSPSVTGGQSNRTLGARMGIRGINDFARNPGFDASMGVYVDGVYAGRSEATSLGLTGIERLEVLRGPQGTLFGKNTVAGALNLTTRKPTDRFEASVNLEGADFGTRNLGVWLGGALVRGTVQASLSIGQEKTDGWVDNLNRPDVRPGSGDGTTVRGFVRFKPGRSTQIDAALWQYRYKGVPMVGEAVAPSALAGLAPGPRTTSTNAPSEETVDKDGGSVTLETALGSGLTLTSITATQRAENFYSNDDDMAPLDIYFGNNTAKNKQITQELRIASAPDPARDWLVGLFYMKQDNDQVALLTTGAAFPVAPLRQRTTTSVGTMEGDALALFVHGNLRLSERLQFTGGLRATRETKDVTLSQTPIPGLAANIPLFAGQVSDNDVSPKVGLNWFVRPMLMVYGSYTQGFKSGGYNMDLIGAAVTQPAVDLRFNKQKVESFELGWKSEWLDRRLRANGSIYRMDGKDYQVQQFVLQPNGTSVATITNAGEVRIDGIEFDLQARVTPSFTVRGGIAYTDATFISFKNGGGVGVNFDGNRLPFAPRLKSALSVEHVMPLGGLQVRSSLGYTHTGDQTSNANGAAVNRIPGHDLFNARIGLEGGETRRWSVALWARNLTNREYTTVNATNALQQARAIYGSPRTVGLQASLDL